jgi:hypothetical protein
MRKNMDFETKLAVVEAGQGVENVHSWHAILHSAGHTTEELDTFWAAKRDDLYWGYNMSGDWGRDEVYAYWAGGLEGNALGMYARMNELFPETKDMDPLPLSEYSIHAVGLPVIEVGEDLDSARAVFYSTGMLCRNIATNGKKMAVWMLERYGEDYVLEDGYWKIVHECVLNDSGGPQDVTNFGADAYNKFKNPNAGRPGPGGGGPGGPDGGKGGPGGPGGGAPAGGPGGPGAAGPGKAANGKEFDKKAFSKMAGGGPTSGSLPGSHITYTPVQTPQDSTPLPKPFKKIDEVDNHYVIGIGENKGAFSWTKKAAGPGMH